MVPHGRSASRRTAWGVAKLDGWLQTMRQATGYGGPVAHWWASTYHYTGPGLDWRYQGLLAGYGDLCRKAAHTAWRDRVETAGRDLICGQQLDGSFGQSRFEANPGSLGTPHEAAAAHGLLLASDVLEAPEAAVTAATRSLDHLIARLWDTTRRAGFADAIGTPGRVPNKLATMAEALMTYAESRGGGGYLAYARTAVDDVLRFQVRQGPLCGAVHQWAPSNQEGDGRFFPYYNARCVPALIQAGRVFGDSRYLEAAHAIVEFLDRTVNQDGTWPQIIYATGRRAEFPHWIAPMADIVLAYRALGRSAPPGALQWLFAGQLPTGGFATADGFGERFRRGRGPRIPDYRDVTGVVGWNDKVLRLLVDLLPDGATIPEARPDPVEILVRVRGELAIWNETADRLVITGLRRSREVLYDWPKASAWADVRDVRLLA